MSDLLASLLGFFTTVVLLMILFQNCSFTVGCGGSHRMPVEHMDVEEEEMEEVGTEESPDANDVQEGYASIDAVGSDPEPPKKMRPHLLSNENHYLEPPFSTNFGHDPHGVPHGYQRKCQTTDELMKESYPHLPGFNMDIYH